MATTDRVYFFKLEKKTTQYGEIIKIGVNEKDIEKLKSNLNERGWANLVFKYNKEGVPFVELDTWQPNSTNNTKSVGNRGAETTTDSENNMPF